MSGSFVQSSRRFTPLKELQTFCEKTSAAEVPPFTHLASSPQYFCESVFVHCHRTRCSNSDTIDRNSDFAISARLIVARNAPRVVTVDAVNPREHVRQHALRVGYFRTEISLAREGEDGRMQRLRPPAPLPYRAVRRPRRRGERRRTARWWRPGEAAPRQAETALVELRSVNAALSWLSLKSFRRLTARPPCPSSRTCRYSAGPTAEHRP